MEGSFEAVAAWWDEQAGDQGDFYHRHLILPALLAALGDVQGLPVLDLGCGDRPLLPGVGGCEDRLMGGR